MAPSRTFGVGLAIMAAACSAGGTSAETADTMNSGGPAGAGSDMPSVVVAGSADQASEGAGFDIGSGPVTFDEAGKPSNLGTERLCDGMDENDNGIIDDVDAGKDGLCDCLSIGFLGDFASDAGNMTGAFETWLEDRSEFPVTHIGATDALNADVLAPLQVIVVGNMTARANSGSSYSADEIAALQTWIEEDAGGLMTLAGYTATESHMDSTQALLGPTGLSYQYSGLGAGVLGGGAPPVLVTGIASPGHPTTEAVDAIGIYYGYPVAGDGEVILRQSGYDLAMAKSLGEGRVFVFADEWITQDLLWMPQATMTALTQCQQQCMQCTDQCAQCDTQCANCQLEPCQGGEPDAGDGTCARGCDQACESCQMNCTTCTDACEVCTADEAATADPTLDVARFWLNVFRWLTPANECQVEIPPILK